MKKLIISNDVSEQFARFLSAEIDELNQKKQKLNEIVTRIDTSRKEIDSQLLIKKTKHLDQNKEVSKLPSAKTEIEEIVEIREKPNNEIVESIESNEDYTDILSDINEKSDSPQNNNSHPRKRIRKPIIKTEKMNVHGTIHVMEKAVKETKKIPVFNLPPITYEPFINEPALPEIKQPEPKIESVKQPEPTISTQSNKVPYISEKPKEPFLLNSIKRFDFIMKILNESGEFLSIDNLSEKINSKYKIPELEPEAWLEGLKSTLKTMVYGKNIIQQIFIKEKDDFFYGLHEWYNSNGTVKEKYLQKL